MSAASSTSANRRKAVQVLNSDGAKMALISLPDVPMHCCIGGEDGKTLFVTTARSVYSVQVDSTTAVAAR